MCACSLSLHMKLKMKLKRVEERGHLPPRKIGRKTGRKTPFPWLVRTIHAPAPRALRQRFGAHPACCLQRVLPAKQGFHCGFRTADDRGGSVGSRWTRSASCRPTRGAPGRGSRAVPALCRRRRRVFLHPFPTSSFVVFLPRRAPCVGRSAHRFPRRSSRRRSRGGSPPWSPPPRSPGPAAG